MKAAIEDLQYLGQDQVSPAEHNASPDQDAPGDALDCDDSPPFSGDDLLNADVVSTQPETDADIASGHGFMQRNVPEKIIDAFRDGDHGKKTLGQLINLSGKMRMLSHRCVMALAMINENSDEAERQRYMVLARTALNDFNDISNILKLGSEELDIPPLFSAALERLLDHEDHEYDRLFQQFRRSANSAIMTMENRDKFARSALSELTDLVASFLLPALNSIVETYTMELNGLVEQENEKARRAALLVSNAAGEISLIGNRVRMIALNALIEANKSAEFGKSFAVIANEIKLLSADVQSAAKKANDNASILARH